MKKLAPSKKAPATKDKSMSRSASGSPARKLPPPPKGIPSMTGSLGMKPSPPPKKETPSNITDELKEQLKAPAKALRVTGQGVEANTLELGLLCDATGSMSSWITRAKQTLAEIIDTVEKEMKKELEEGETFNFRISFIGYRDIKTTGKRFEILSFTDNVDQVKTFINNVEASGGED